MTAAMIDIVAEFFTGPHVAYSSVGLQIAGHQAAMARQFFEARKKLGIEGYATKDEAVAAMIKMASKQERAELA